MKKLSLIVLFVLLCVVFCGCDPGSFNFVYDDLVSEVIGVQLINYKNPNQKKFTSWVFDKSRRLLHFNLDHFTVLETLSADCFENFLGQLAAVEFLDSYFAYNSPKDICLKLDCADGDFIILNCMLPNFGGYVGRYNSKGKIVEFYGCFSSSYDYVALVNNFFETKLSVDL